MITDLKVNEENKRRWYEQGFWTSETVNDVWNRQVREYPDSEYVCDDLGARFTYAEVDDKAARLASWLKSVGVGNGDVVTIQVPPWAEFCIIYVACLKVGAVCHPLSVTFNGEDLVYGMNLVGSKAFICPTFHHKTDFEAQILSVLDRIPSLPENAIAVCDKLKESDGTVTLRRIWEEFGPWEEAPGSKSDDVVLVLSTSGTTGRPKAVLYTHNNLLSGERSFAKALGLTHDDVMFMPAPLNHATGFNHGLILPMSMGARVVLQHEFSASEAIDIMNSEGVTWSMGATPFIFDELNTAERERKDIETMRMFVCGGAPVPGSMVQWAWQHGIRLCECYGSTESSPHMCIPPQDAVEWDGRFSGIPVEGIEVKVVDSQGNEVPHGVQGEEVSRGPNVFVGYLNNREATDKDLSDDGWFHSGDLCVMDDEGRVKINGRKKEIIIRGGENVSVNEIDDNIRGFDMVADCATVGKLDDRLGERIATWIVPAEGCRPTKEQINGYLKSQGIAKRLWTEHVEYIDAIPRTESGKVKRNLLTDMLKERLGL